MNANRYRSRATAYIARNRHAISSAGPRSFCRKKKASETIDTAHDRQEVLEPGHLYPARDLFESLALVAQCAQEFPSFCKVSGQKEDDENANDLGRLKSQQIDLRVTAGWSGTEEDESGREQEAGDEKNVA